MPIINNDNISPTLTTTSATDMNTKLTDVASASAGLDDDNVRGEGIDRRNLGATALLKSIEWTTNDATTSTTYAAEDGGLPFEINHGSDLRQGYGPTGITIEDGDLIRVKFSVYVDEVSQVLTTTLAAYCLLIFPTWDITDATLTNFECFPDKADLFRTAVAPYPVDISGGFGETDISTSGIALYPITGYDTGATIEVKKNMHGSLIYQHSGASVTLYGIRIYGRGPMHYEHHGTPGADGRAFVYDPAAFGTVDFEISRGSLGVIIMHKGDS
jgi:hypothetical protein